MFPTISDQPSPQSGLLTAPQHQVLSLLAAGGTILAAADTVGVHRNTVHNWRRGSAPFRSALHALAYEQTIEFRDEIHSLAPLAIDALRNTLTSSDTSPSLRLRAALAVLKHVTTPHALETAPEPEILVPPAPEPEKIVHNSAQAEPPAEPAFERPLDPAPYAEVRPGAQPYRRPTPKTGRNEPCPCGSGLKHKRCCLLKSTDSTAGQTLQAASATQADSTR
jgi:hypothetical protein